MKHSWNEFVEEMKESLHRVKWNISRLIENRRYGALLRFAVAFCMILFFVGLGMKESYVNGNNLQESIASEIIRFHVIANSDSEEDQAVKLKVKDAVITALRPKMAETKNLDEARETIVEEMDFIKEVALDELARNGFDYSVVVSLQQEQFPVKVYGDITLPAGQYEALCVRIGKAEGKNWWCIVFPSLCYVDETYGYVPEESKEQLKNVLTEEEYEEITQEDDEKTEELKIKIKFKLWDYLKEYF